MEESQPDLLNRQQSSHLAMCIDDSQRGLPHVRAHLGRAVPQRLGHKEGKESSNLAHWQQGGYLRQSQCHP